MRWQLPHLLPCLATSSVFSAVASASSTAASTFVYCVSQDVCQILHEKFAREGSGDGGVGGCLQLELKVGNAGA